MYERMKYGHDQRAWVKYVDHNLPDLLEEASEQQKHAAQIYAYIDDMRNKGYPIKNIWFDLREHASRQAVMLLNRVLYYQGMRRANLPGEE